MPFQSEKQRRYLHANHPEIAKRWERDYGDGGIAALNAQLNQLPEYYLPAADGGRIGFFKGAQADTARGHAMSPGTSASGGLRHSGNGGGGGGGGHHAPVHTGPSPAELAKQKAAAEAAAAAAKKAADIKAHKEWITKKGKEKKKKVKHKSKLERWEDHAKFTEGMKTQNLKNYHQLGGLDFMTKFNVSPQTAKNLSKGYQYATELTRALMNPFDDKTIKGALETAQHEAALNALGIDVYGTDNALTKEYAGLTEAGTKKYAHGGISNHFKKRVKLKDSIESISDEEFKMMYPDWDPTQFSKEDYLQYISENEGNGVLDLSSDDQPIEFASTETDEIIPDLLAPDSASGILNFAKDGGRIGFFTGMREQEQRQQEHSTRGPRDDPDRGGPVQTVAPVHVSNEPPSERIFDPSRVSEPTVTTSTGSGRTRIQDERQEDFRKQQMAKIITRGEEEKTEEWEKSKDAPWNQKTHPLKTLGKIATFWVTLGASGLIEVPQIVQLAATSYSKYNEAQAIYNKAKKAGLLPKHMKDVSWDDIMAKAGGSVKANFDELKRKMDLYNSLPDGHPEKIALSIELEIGKKPEHLGDGYQEIPRVEEITEELIEATEEGDAVDIMSVWDRIKNRQAKRSMLVEQGIIQGEPIALANSGGLANLFRVKNQY